MKTVTQTMLYRQALIKYSLKYGVTKAAIRYKTNRQYVYRWRKRYDGTLQSLADKSHRPHHHPNEHTPEELKLIADMRKRNMNAGLVVFWVKLRQRGYTRSVTGLYRLLRKQGQMAVKPPNPKYIPKPYEQMQYPGQRVQIDVKFVPESCIVGEAKGQKFYQYTAIDEYSRFRYLEAFEEHSSYSSAQFIKHLIEKFPFRIECVQTDNGMEFTKQLGNTQKPTPTLFERTLEQCGISLLLRTRLDTTERLNVLIVKITNIFMPHILFIHLKILKSNFLFTTEDTIIFLCVLLIGNLLLII